MTLPPPRALFLPLSCRSRPYGYHSCDDQLLFSRLTPSRLQVTILAASVLGPHSSHALVLFLVAPIPAVSVLMAAILGRPFSRPWFLRPYPLAPFLQQPCTPLL
ncbi:hypothetical protein BOTBODRAFT_181303 [Botryobasidium botryosum FD-172 SS1]|uniref:Uncharacterized protein n=1 Tax=Botryobasidium botryosum (strain FD-172 SS1) TaxID=930990 RepID=A0A067LWP0_BOTB1|nr:hypothetical protein BOTBODRAFT_181303 [Botryobasidium botryosum FD-172 SS1]